MVMFSAGISSWTTVSGSCMLIPFSFSAVKVVVTRKKIISRNMMSAVLARGMNSSSRTKRRLKFKVFTPDHLPAAGALDDLLFQLLQAVEEVHRALLHGVDDLVDLVEEHVLGKGPRHGD